MSGLTVKTVKYPQITPNIRVTYPNIQPKEGVKFDQLRQAVERVEILQLKMDFISFQKHCQSTEGVRGEPTGEFLWCQEKTEKAFKRAQKTVENLCEPNSNRPYCPYMYSQKRDRNWFVWGEGSTEKYEELIIQWNKEVSCKHPSPPIEREIQIGAHLIKKHIPHEPRDADFFPPVEEDVLDAEDIVEASKSAKPAIPGLGLEANKNSESNISAPAGFNLQFESNRSIDGVLGSYESNNRIAISRVEVREGKRSTNSVTSGNSTISLTGRTIGLEKKAN